MWLWNEAYVYYKIVIIFHFELGKILKFLYCGTEFSIQVANFTHSKWEFAKKLYWGFCGTLCLYFPFWVGQNFEICHLYWIFVAWVRICIWALGLSLSKMEFLMMISTYKDGIKPRNGNGPHQQRGRNRPNIWFVWHFFNWHWNVGSSFHQHGVYWFQKLTMGSKIYIIITSPL